MAPQVLSVELKGEFDSNTVLGFIFRAEHFDFFDLTTNQLVDKIDPFPGTCIPRDPIHRDDVLEMHTSKSHVEGMILEDVNPLSDPVRQLEVDHEHRIAFKPQTVCCFAGMLDELFGDQDSMAEDLLPEGDMVTLESADELFLKIEAV